MTIEIPERLRGFNFVLLGKINEETGEYNCKAPMEKAWQKLERRTDNPKLIKHLSEGKNYGVQCGDSSSIQIEGNVYSLIVVDFDSFEFQEKVLKELPETFSVKTGGKGLLHLYFTSDFTKSFKVLGEKLANGKRITLADVQGEGKQVVGAGSLNDKTGKRYEVIKDIPIAFIHYDELCAILKPYDLSEIDKKEKPKRQFIPKNTDGDIAQKILNALTIEQAFSEIGVDTSVERFDCPVHQSTSGKCVKINSNGTAKCFGCGKSWNAYSLLKEVKNWTDKKTWDFLAEKAGVVEELKQSRKKYVEESEDEYTDSETLVDGKPTIAHPRTGRLISKFVAMAANILKDKNKLFYRPDLREIVEVRKIKTNNQMVTGFSILKSSKFITLLEDYAVPIVVVPIENKETKKTEWVEKPKSITSELANTTLASQVMCDSMPLINRIFTVPLPIIYDGKLTFPIKGYDARFNSWLVEDAPEITNLNMPLKNAKKILKEIYSEFCFKDKQDKINAIAALLTPFCRGIFKAFNTRTPVNFYLGNRERAGKDYCAGITGILYEGAALEDAPISNSENERSNNTDELRKKILAAFICGRKRMHFSNNKGHIDNAVLEGITTAERWSDRILGKSENLTFDNEIDFSLSGNVGVTFTADFANRSRFIRLLLDVEDANSRKFKKSDLHGWVRENRGLILSALYSLVSNWIKKGRCAGSKPFTSFPEWAQVIGGIMLSAGYGSPCELDKETLSLSGDVETSDMKQLFELMYEKMPETFIDKTVIRNYITLEGEGLFSNFDFTERADQTKFALKLGKYIGRVLSGIRLVVQDATVRSARQQLKFTKNKGDNT